MAATATQIKNFVGGEERDGAQNGTEPILNPANEEEIATAPKSGESDVDAAVNAAYEAFGTWGYSTPQDRATALLKIADAIEENADELAQLESMNVGKPIELVKSEELPVVVDQPSNASEAARTAASTSSSPDFGAVAISSSVDGLRIGSVPYCASARSSPPTKLRISVVAVVAMVAPPKQPEGYGGRARPRPE